MIIAIGWKELRLGQFRRHKSVPVFFGATCNRQKKPGEFMAPISGACVRGLTSAAVWELVGGQCELWAGHATRNRSHQFTRRSLTWLRVSSLNHFPLLDTSLHSNDAWNYTSLTHHFALRFFSATINAFPRLELTHLKEIPLYRALLDIFRLPLIMPARWNLLTQSPLPPLNQNRYQ